MFGGVTEIRTLLLSSVQARCPLLADPDPNNLLRQLIRCA
ncbi:hypothetical protein [Klebsiella phage vB_KpnS-VAC35]|uniref:Uncharacterized protein n=1 Tax=Klebsiella phage vB_KpnS-VAC35 TaxID=2866696 RepID=A0AAE8YES4_9CAUD|nr:hypothetical protein [Klebsiella phage vB_KpnS-VAC35]